MYPIVSCRVVARTWRQHNRGLDLRLGQKGVGLSFSVCFALLQEKAHIFWDRAFVLPGISNKVFFRVEGPSTSQSVGLSWVQLPQQNRSKSMCLCKEALWNETQTIQKAFKNESEVTQNGFPQSPTISSKLAERSPNLPRSCQDICEKNITKKTRCHCKAAAQPRLFRFAGHELIVFFFSFCAEKVERI